MADPRLMVVVVRAPERRELAEQIGALVGKFRRTHPVGGFRAGLFPDLQQLVADLVDGLFPGDAGPLAVDQLGRIFDPAVAVHEFATAGPLGPMRAAVEARKSVVEGKSWAVR